MTSSTTHRLPAAVLAVLALVAAATTFGSASEPKFRHGDPLLVDRDTEDAAGMKPLEPSLFVDFVYNVVTGRGPVTAGRAKNVNSIDEVPDSSWFTNRAGHAPLTPADVARGPDMLNGPATGAWTVVSSKSDGVTPGFTVKDASGQRWFLKFDPPGFRGMATGTEVVMTKLMWALGYNVPENHIAYMRREQLVMGDGARFAQPGGRQRAMRIEDIDSLLERADRESDGSYRVVASRALEGTPIGRIRFDGTRPDDPNDVVPHQDRRELRGYGTFAAWLNHVDSKSINSLDMLATRDGRSFVRHHLIDFGSALGSGAIAPTDYWAGTQYLVEGGMTAKQMIGFGFVHPKYHTQPFFESAAIGRLPLDNAGFDPEQWKPRIPNQAFLHARADDKFWAAQKLMALTTDLLEAAVDAADLRDPASEAFLVRALAERRDAIGRAYLTAINPISDPVLDDYGFLTFRNAAVDADLARAPRGYRAQWATFDNFTRATTVIGSTASRSPEMEAPGGLPTRPGTYVRVELSAVGSSNATWETPVHAYYLRTAGGWRLVGFERMPETTAAR